MSTPAKPAQPNPQLEAWRRAVTETRPDGKPPAPQPLTSKTALEQWRRAMFGG